MKQTASPTKEHNCTCSNCKQTFYTLPSSIRRGEGKFCNPACYHEHRKWTHEKFWRHVHKTESCWIWTASVDHKGYGQCKGPTNTPKTWRAHRVAWYLKYGSIDPNLQLCHDCPGGENILCVNPDHMFLGSNYDNVQDMVKKGRNSRGEKHPWAKLTEKQVLEIKTKVAQGLTQESIARDYNICRQTISDIHRGVRWKHLKAPSVA